MIQNMTQNIASFAKEHPFKFGASALVAVVAIECAISAIKSIYDYTKADDEDLKKKHWEELKVNLGGAATYGILASNYLAPNTGLLGGIAFVVYAIYKVQLTKCKQEDVYHMTWIIGNIPSKIWDAVKDVFSYLDSIFRQRPIVIAGCILTTLVVIKTGAIAAAFRYFSNLIS